MWTYSTTLLTLNGLRFSVGLGGQEETEMKKIYSMLLMLVTGMVAMCLASCISENAEEVKLANDEVKVCFTYTLDTSNGTSMTRATGNSAVFNEFYEKIKTGELVAPTYDLTLTEVNTGATYSFKGSWANHEP